jgi:hypothetical protein
LTDDIDAVSLFFNHALYSTVWPHCLQPSHALSCFIIEWVYPQGVNDTTFPQDVKIIFTYRLIIMKTGSEEIRVISKLRGAN